MMSCISEAQETYKYYTKQEFGAEMNTDRMHVVEKGITVGERVLRFMNIGLQIKDNAPYYNRVGFVLSDITTQIIKQRKKVMSNGN